MIPTEGCMLAAICLMGKAELKRTQRAVKEGAESNVQERDIQQTCLDSTVTSQEGRCFVKALSKAGVLISMHR